MNGTKNSKMKITDKLVKVYQTVKKVELLSSAVVLLGLLTDVLGFFGISVFDVFPKLKSFFFENEESNELYRIIRCIFILIFIVGIILTIIIYIGNKWYADCTLIRGNLYGKIINKMLYDKKYISSGIVEATANDRYKDLFQLSVATNDNPFAMKKSRVHPGSAIDKVVKSAGELLCDMFGLDKNSEDLNICLVYKDKKNKWTTFSNFGSQRSNLDIKELFKDDNPSSFNYVLKYRKEEVFYLDKQKAIDDRKYYRLPNEMNNSIMGSIYCKNLSIYDDKNQIIEGLILSISTKQYSFCNNDDFSIEQCKIAFRYIESMISYEFTKLYLYNHCGLGGWDYVSEKNKKK